MRAAASTVSLLETDLLALPPSRSLGSLSSRLSSTSSFHSVFSEDSIREAPDRETDHVHGGGVEAHEDPPGATTGDLVMTSCVVYLIPEEEAADLVTIVKFMGPSPSPSISALSDIHSEPPPDDEDVNTAQLAVTIEITASAAAATNWMSPVPATADSTYTNTKIVV